MCGRYFIDEEMYHEIQKLLKEINLRLHSEISQEIFPSALAPVIFQKNNILIMENHAWGFPHFKNSGVIFNARCETALDKKLFSDSIKKRRCVIPATCYYEWTGQKDKCIIRDTEDKPLFFAGFYNHFEDIQDDNSVDFILHKVPGKLKYEVEGQMSLFL